MVDGLLLRGGLQESREVVSQDTSEDLRELLAACWWCKLERETCHDDGDGQQDPVEQSRIPVDGLHHRLSHDGRHVGENKDAVMVSSDA